MSDDRRELHEEREGFWSPNTPRRLWPRRVHRLFDALDLTLMLGQPLMGYTPVSDQKLISGARGHDDVGVGAGLSNVNSSNINWRQSRRSGGAVKETFGRTWGPLTFNHILDPTGAYAGWTPIMQDLLLITFTAGNGRVFFGSFSFNTAEDETSVVGVGFRTNNTDGYWTTVLRDGTGTPSTVLHETALTTVTSTVPRRLSVVLDATTKSVLWYADGVLVDSYTPVAAISAMTNIPLFGYFGITDAAADLRILHFGGGNPRLLTLTPA